MKEKAIYPCLWFDHEASDASRFYCSIFMDSAILQENPMVSLFELSGSRFMGLNGGPLYQKNSSISFFVYCGSEAEIDRLYDVLSEGGQVLFPIGSYDWSARYAWVVDRFGVNWQLDVDAINNSQKIVPCLLFGNEKAGLVKEAALYYTSLFQPSAILFEYPAPAELGMPADSQLFMQFRIGPYILNAMSGGREEHSFDFTPGISIVIECDTQEEIDHFWDELGNGGRYDMCGWLVDRYGVSWQVFPSVLPRLLEDPERAPRVIEAFRNIQKFNINDILNA